MNVSTRFRITISSLLVPVVFLVLNILEPNISFARQYQGLVLPTILGVLQMVLVAWVVHFKLKGERIFTVLGFPGLSLGVFVAFLDIVIRTSGNTLDRVSTIIASAVILFVVSYLLSASINILNLSTIKVVPLGQAARAAHYVLTLIFSYFSFVLIISYDFNFLLKYAVVLGVVFLYTFVALWTISLAYSQRFTSSLGIALLVMFVYMVLSIWPLDSFYLALFLVLVYYMSLGVSLEIREILNKWISYEYAAIFIAMLVLLLTTASWGINGTIL